MLVYNLWFRQSGFAWSDNSRMRLSSPGSAYKLEIISVACLLRRGGIFYPAKL